VPAGKKRGRKKRVRRSAEEARVLILDAAEKRLSEVGPAGVRLQEIAADVGMTHPTILHHFGSREGLVNAVVQRSLVAVQQDVMRAFTAHSFEASDAADLLGRVAATLQTGGHARLLMWLALEGHPPKDPATMLKGLAETLHARREGQHGPVPLEDTVFLLVLSLFVVLAETTVGPGAWESAGLTHDSAAPGRFHAWFVDLLRQHIAASAPGSPPQRGGETATVGS
jgi:AcrR family transcriptional regulator